LTSRPHSQINMFECFVHICSGCGDRFIGGHPKYDPASRDWHDNHSKSSKHLLWDQKELTRICKHDETKIVTTGGDDGLFRHWKLCKLCRKTLNECDLNGNDLEEGA